MYAEYGIDPRDARYQRQAEFAHPPLCFCGKHSELSPRANCDLQARRAWDMVDPVWCWSCDRVAERHRTDARPSSLIGACDECRRKWPSPKPGRRRSSMSLARLRYAEAQTPLGTLKGLSRDEVFCLAFDEVRP